MASLPIHPLWLHQSHVSTQPVRLSQSVALIRNLEGFPFSTQASNQQRKEVSHQLLQALQHVPNFQKEWVACPWENASHAERALLQSTVHLANPCDETVVWYHQKSFLQIITHDEDHIRLQWTKPSGTLKSVWQSVNELEETLGTQVRYAFTPQQGYFTSSLETLGMGLQIRVLLHLPALCFDQQLPALIQAASEMDLQLKPIQVVNDKVLGHLFYLSNRVNLGTDEKTLLAHVEKVTEQLVTEELRVRKEMLTKHTTFTQDSVGRAIGLLKNCYELSFEEASNLLSILLMAVDNGMLPKRQRSALTLLWNSLSRENLSEFCQKAIPLSEESHLRAQIVKATLAQWTAAFQRKVSHGS